MGHVLEWGHGSGIRSFPTLTTHTLLLSDTHWESAWGPLLKYRSQCLPNTAFHSCENLLIKENESMKWAQLSHFAQLDGMQLGLVKIIQWVNGFKILQKMRSHVVLPIMTQWNDYMQLSRLTTEIKGSGFGKNINI